MDSTPYPIPIGESLLAWRSFLHSALCPLYGCASVPAGLAGAASYGWCPGEAYPGVVVAVLGFL